MSSPTRGRRVRPLILMVCVAVALGVTASLTTGATGSVRVVSGNPSCQDLNSAWTEVKIDPVDQGGPHAFSGGTYTRTGDSIDFTSTDPVRAVIVKGGPNANVYDYPSGATSDTGLTPPGSYGVSHLSFCYGPLEPPPTTTSTTTPTTTTTTTTQGVAPSTTTTPVQGSAPSKSCRSRRTFRIRLRYPHGERLVSATVYVNGKRVAVLKGRRLRSRIDLRGLPAGRYTVRIVGRTQTGRRVTGTRRYYTCRKKRFPQTVPGPL